jgi:hypothetical protein
MSNLENPVIEANGYLTKRGWLMTGPTKKFAWTDPMGTGNWSWEGAYSIQVKRDAIRLDTALAALESAEPLLEALADEGRYVESVAEALAKIRAVREGRNA